jgi:hypothetical protein
MAAEEARERGAIRVAALALLLLVAASLYLASFGKPGYQQDEGLLVAYPDFVNRGLVPNLDFQSMYGPADAWVIAAAFRLFGSTIGVERGVGLVYRLLIVASLFVLAARSGRVAAGLVCGAMAAVLFLPLGLAALAWVGGVAVALLSLCAAAEAGERRLTLWGASGLLSGLAVGFRPDLAVLTAALVPMLRRASPAGRMRCAVGWILGVVPLLAHVLRLGIGRAWDAMVVESVLRTVPGRRLPILSSALVPQIAVVACAAALLVGAVLWTGVRSTATAGLDVAASEALFAALLLPQLLQRPDAWHLCLVSALVLPLAVSGGAMLTRPERVPLLSAAALIAALAIYPGIGIAVNDTLALVGRRPYPGAYWVRRGTRAFPLELESQARDLQTVLEKAEPFAARGGSLFVGPRDLRRANYCDTFVYFLEPQLRPASYFTEMNPGVANREGSRLAGDLAAADYLLLTPLYDEWDERNASKVPGSETPGRLVAESFCLRIVTGSYALLARCPPHRSP